MKAGVFIVLLIMITGLLCPSGITIIHSADDAQLISLNVCNDHDSSFTANSDIPALNTANGITTVISKSNLIQKEKTILYRFLLVRALLKPPYA
jgi:hypothetical protein